jgi:GTP-binding protein Era
MNAAFAFAEDLHDLGREGPWRRRPARWLAGEMPEGPWLYPEDQIADLPMRMIAAEMTREKLTLRLHQELPYQLTVETENWEERKDGSARIDQVIYVARDGHKGIVLGNKGETIKAVSKAARARSWRRSSAARCICSCRSRCARLAGRGERYSEMGLDFKDGNWWPPDRRVLGAGLSGAAAAGRHPAFVTAPWR